MCSICACTLWVGAGVPPDRVLVGEPLVEAASGLLKWLRVIVRMWLSLVLRFAGVLAGMVALIVSLGLEEGKGYWELCVELPCEPYKRDRFDEASIPASANVGGGEGKGRERKRSSTRDRRAALRRQIRREGSSKAVFGLAREGADGPGRVQDEVLPEARELPLQVARPEALARRVRCVPIPQPLALALPSTRLQPAVDVQSAPGLDIRLQVVYERPPSLPNPVAHL